MLAISHKYIISQTTKDTRYPATKRYSIMAMTLSGRCLGHFLTVADAKAFCDSL